METKQALSNTFSDGLNTDLHPLITPNTVLTDCINGTIMTNNGNEYNLQNDLGNYELKNAKLPVNYVPIGMKEYNGIIYIVSYNPITKRSQIGTFPSPEQLNNKTFIDEVELNQIDINEKSENVSYLMAETCHYSYYKKQETPTLFNTEDIKINDQFKIDLEDGAITAPFQEFELYLVNQSGKQVKLDLNFGETVSHKKQISGQLKLTNVINNLNSFNTYIDNIKQAQTVDCGDYNLDPNRVTNEPLTFILNGEVTFKTEYNLELGFEIHITEFKTENNSTRKQYEPVLVGVKEYSSVLGITTAMFEYNFEKPVVHDSDLMEIIIVPYATKDNKVIVFDNYKNVESIQLEKPGCNDVGAETEGEDPSQSLEENES